MAFRFRIVRLIGAGGMGEVYAARDLLLDEEVALKTVRQGSGTASAAVDGLRREVIFARRVSHPGVCRVYELFRHLPAAEGDDAALFLTMELLAGENLRDRLRREGPPRDQTARRIARQVAEALGALHGAGVVHGDLKPSNVFLVPTPAGDRVVLTDFGLAGTVVRSEARPADVLGTPGFMAPELRQGSGPTQEADVYAFGALLHALVTGLPPADGEVVGQLPAGWRGAVQACLRPAVEKRPQSVLSLLENGGAPAIDSIDPRIQGVVVLAWSPSRRQPTSGAPTAAERRFRRLFAERLGSSSKLRVALVDLDEVPPTAEAASAARTAMSGLPDLVLTGASHEKGGMLAVELELIESDDPTGSVVVRDRGPAAEPTILAQRLASRIGRWLQPVPPAAEVQPRGIDRTCGGDASYRAAVEHLQRHEPEMARRRLLDALQLGAVDSRSYEVLARATQLLGDAREAELYAQRAIDLATGASREDVLSLEALRFEIGGEWRAAARLHQALWTTGPNDGERGRRLALALARAGKGREALAVVAAVRSQPGEGRAEPASLDLTEAEAAERAGDLLRALAAGRRASLRARRRGLGGLVAEARLAQGVILRRLGRYREAGRVLTSAAHRFERERRMAEAADAMRRLVEVQRYLPGVDPDLAIAHRAMQLSSEVGHRAGMAASLSQLGVLKMLEGDFEGAEGHLHEALAHSRAIGDLAGVAQSLGNLALIDYEFGKLRRASSRHDQARRLYQEVGNRWAATKERLSLGVVDLALGRPARALRILESVAADLRALGADSDAATTECISVEARLELGEASAGRRTLARAIRTGRRVGSEHLVRAACLVAGMVETELDRPGPARRSLDRARRGAEDSNHLTAELRMIDLDLAQGRLQSAACRAEALYERAVENANHSLVTMALGRLAEVRLQQGSDAAVAVARRALDDAAELEDVVEVSRVRLRCGYVLARLGWLDEGVGLLTSTLDAARDSGLVLVRLQTELRLGTVELAEGFAERGRDRLRAVEAEARSRHLYLLARKASDQLGQHRGGR